MEATMPQHVRKKFIVKRDFQFRIFLQLMVYLFFIGILVAWTVYLGVFRTILFELSGEKLTLINRFVSLQMAMWFIPSVFAILIVSVFFSHKIAGPIFVFQRTIRCLSRGENPAKVRLRKGDMLSDLACDLNRLIDLYEKRSML